MTFSVVSQLEHRVGGLSFTQNESVLADQLAALDKSVGVAYAGTLTTRTDDDTGVITITPGGAGANFVATDRVDVYWEVSGVKGSRRGMKVSSVAGDAITVGTVAGDIGVGDIFPAAASVVQLAKSTAYELRFDGADLKALFGQGEARSIIVIASSVDTEELYIHIATAGMVYAWLLSSGVANPLAGDVITKVFVSHNDTTASKVVKVAAPYSG